MAEPTLLTTSQMAEFVARGVLEFPGLIEADLNAAAIDELDQISATWGSPERPFAPSSGDPLDCIYPDPSAVGAVLRHRVVAGAIHSLVGHDATFDHDFVHLRPPGDVFQQPLHADAIIDTSTSFDIQVFYFPHEVAADGGGTGFVPGTHLRQVHETAVGRYQHLAGERQWTGPAGSVVVFHQGLWHRGMPNPGAARRLMYKIRLNPVRAQRRLWETSDLAALHGDHRDHIFATFDMASVAGMLRRRERWMGEADFRLELVARARLWRYLTGDDRFDVDWYLTRIESHAAIDHGDATIGLAQ